MFNVGGGELIVIALIALIVLGPTRLPGAARQVGKTMTDLRRLSSGFQNELRAAFDDAERSKAPATAAPPETTSVVAAIHAVSAQATPPAAKPAARRSAAKKTPAKKAPAKKAAPQKASTKRAAPSKKARAVPNPARRRSSS